MRRWNAKTEWGGCVSFTDVSDEILINVTRLATRAAWLVDGVLAEVQLEHSGRGSVRGNIYRGRVKRVLPGMNAAFLDIGLERNAFLHGSDLQASSANPSLPIDERLSPGQDLMVQVTREPLGSKGARVSARLSIPSRYLVLIPGSDDLGVSMRIGSEAERERLRELLSAMPTHGCGYIARTNAEGVDEPALERDRQFLQQQWEAIQAAYRQAQSGTRVYAELDLALRVVRDLAGFGVDRVLVDDAACLARMRSFSERLPGVAPDGVELYQGVEPMFDQYGVEVAIQGALQSQVPLPSGGYLVIESGEAMTMVDVNTGSFVGGQNLEATLYRTNLEAAEAIPGQLRLRNVGGIVVVDFIDLENADHKTQVLKELEAGLARDPARTRLGAMSPLGLVELTRKRSGMSLLDALCEDCPRCGGLARIKRVESVCGEILRELRRVKARAVCVRVAPEVAAAFDEQPLLADGLNLEQVTFQPESGYQREQFELVLD